MANLLSKLTRKERVRLLEELNYMNLAGIRGFCSARGIPYRIVAEYPGAEPREITGLHGKSDVDDWMNGDRRIGWLRSQGYAK